jgi:hypothetical protein
MSPTRHSTTIGLLDRCPPRALQSRAAFLNGRPSYLLSFWEVADSHQLLQSSLQRLTNNTGAVDASSAPSVRSTYSGSTHSGGSRNQQGRWHHSQEEQQDQQLFTPLMESLRDLAESQQQMRIDREQDQVHERDMEEKRRHSERREHFRKRLFQRRTELVDLARKYCKLNAELDMSDERSRQLSD